LGHAQFKSTIANRRSTFQSSVCNLQSALTVFSKIRQLSKNITIYGLGDVAVSIVSFFLLPVYVLYFDAAAYGVINVLVSIEVIAKIVFRFGLDGSFMRFYYEADDARGRQRLASTIFLFLFVLDGAVLVALLLASPALSTWLLGSRAYVNALRLMLVNTFVIGFTFIPFHVLRMEQRAKTFSLLTLARSVLTIVVRLALVTQSSLGVTGLYLADILVTAVIMTALVPWFARLIRPVFSTAALRESLRFGLPRLPHAAAQQITAVGDKFLLTMFVPLSAVGVYGQAVGIGLAQKLFLSAFESAWAPFYYATIRESDAPRVFRTVSTYGLAVLALLTAGVSATGRDALRAMTHGRILPPLDPGWHDVSLIVAFTSIGVFFQGFYLLTSIGLNITKQTQYYPVATISAAAVNVTLNLLLIPRLGIVGAGWANAVAYAVQAMVGYFLSQRFYPIAYEWARIARVCAAAATAYLAAILLPALPVHVDPHRAVAWVPDVLMRGTTVVIVFGGLLAVTGFFHSGELDRLRALRRRGGPSRTTRAPDSTEMAGEVVATDIEAPE
jgi:O-antigen/teichoic acid export membrane protein